MAKGIDRGSHIRAAWAAAIVAIAVPSFAAGFTLKSLIMPGKVIAGHAKIEEKCDSCHESRETEKQSELCFVCHKEVRADLATRSGFHGRSPDVAKAECSSCHAEHEGRDAAITSLDVSKFAHEHTDFPLLGAHRSAECSQCHAEGKAFRGTPQRCSGCHAEDDPHGGSLGAACEGCHTAGSWGAVELDHAKTRFALDGAHANVECAGCHAQAAAAKFSGAPTECAQCHRADDVHAGRNGAECGSCHTSTAWPVAAFDHATAASFRLTGAHSKLLCQSCHVENLAAELPRTCVGCHKTDDPHAGRLGTSCSDCHQSAQWPTSFDHAHASGFALGGAHADLECTTCHASGIDAPLGRECASCHAAGDPHRGQLGGRCETCHSDAAWAAPIRFMHDLAKFPLLGKHAGLKCSDCHATAAFHDAGDTCADCHGEDDPHSGSFGGNCGSCHNATAWEAWRFDHDRSTTFPLTGAHRNAACAACHRSEAPRGATARRGDDCAQCHRRDDPHHGQFGAACGECHGTDSFSELRGR
jgi:hypothetical protein